MNADAVNTDAVNTDAVNIDVAKAGIPIARHCRFTLYGNRLSPFVRKIGVLMREKSIPYELVQFNVFTPPPWFAGISPLRRMPVLRDGEVEGGGFLADSSVIAAYLERVFPSPALFPADAWNFGRALWIEEYADTEVALRIGTEIFRPRVVSRFVGGECDEALVQAALTGTLPPFFAYLESQLAGQEYFVGGTFSIADIAVAASFVNLHHAGETVDPAVYPGLAAFLDRMHKRDSFAPLIALEQQMINRFHATA